MAESPVVLLQTASGHCTKILQKGPVWGCPISYPSYRLPKTYAGVRVPACARRSLPRKSQGRRSSLVKKRQSAESAGRNLFSARNPLDLWNQAETHLHKSIRALPWRPTANRSPDDFLKAMPNMAENPSLDPVHVHDRHKSRFPRRDYPED
jgi:hypothetical protein